MSAYISSALASAKSLARSRNLSFQCLCALILFADTACIEIAVCNLIVTSSPSHASAFVTAESRRNRSENIGISYRTHYRWNG